MRTTFAHARTAFDLERVFVSGFVLALLFSWTNSAAAEVLDKLEFPWQPDHWIRMLVVLVAASALAASKHMPIRVAGLIVALVWATISLWADPWFTPDIGNALRTELTAEQNSKWLTTILAQALIPVGITLIVFLGRTLQSALRHQAPR